MKRAFLTARWSNLVLVTYAVPPAALQPLLPPSCEPDLIDGQAFVSLVAFDFLDTRVLGVRWPGFVNFPEINLRFYVKREGKRGVSFVRELVPSRLIAWIALALYNEPYRRAAMRSQVRDEAGRRHIEHEVDWRGRGHRIRASGALPPYRPSADSLEHFFKEHDLGYGRTRRGALLTYAVEHPHWDVLGDPRLELDWGFADVYGPEWGFLDAAQPYSLAIATGSEVAVSPLSLPGR